MLPSLLKVKQAVDDFNFSLSVCYSFISLIGDVHHVGPPEARRE